jgi:hypothetical protein
MNGTPGCRVFTLFEMRRASHSLIRAARVVVVSLLFPVLALAQSASPDRESARAEAAKQFEEGAKAFDRGDFVHAADAFELAFGLVPHIDSLWNAARARQRADDLPRAATLYARYLREAPADARDRNVATALLASLEARLGRIEVHGSGIDELVVDERRSQERIIYVSPGAHVVRAVVAGAIEQQTPELGPGDVVGLVFEPPARKPDRQVPTTLPAPPPPGRVGGSPWLVVGGGILTGVAVAATIASGVSTLAARDTFDASPTASNLASGQAMQARTNILLGVSIGLGAMTTATAVWLVDWRGSTRSSARLGIRATRVEAEWRF